MIETQIAIINKLGLHARAAAKFAATATHYGSDIRAGVGGKLVDAKSVMSLMLLAANQGTELQLTVAGDDEQEAYTAIAALINDRFGEAE